MAGAKVEVEIPQGRGCQHEDKKPCIMARYTKKWNAYNCKLFNRILKGNITPRKCAECLERYGNGGGADEGHNQVRQPTGRQPEVHQ